MFKKNSHWKENGVDRGTAQNEIITVQSFFKIFIEFTGKKKYRNKK